MPRPSVIVLGGGIIGALTAYELSKNGAEVTLLEKSRFNEGASSNSAAMLEFQLDAHRGEPFFSLAQASHELFPDLHKELLKLTGIDMEFERCGILQVALTQSEADLLKKQVDANIKKELRVKWLTPAEVKKHQPDLAGPHFGGALFEEDGQVDGRKFLEAALAGARKKGAELLDDCGECRLVIEKDYVTGVEIKEGVVNADFVVVAAGAHADQILSQIGIQLGVEPVRGQLVVFKTEKKIPAYPIYTTSGGYLTPKNGYTLAGTTVECVGFDCQPTLEGRRSILKQITTLFPAFKDIPVLEMRAGLRPRSPDDLPLLGPLPTHPNVLAATGHYRNGILLAPITAQLISHFILGTVAEVVPAPYLPYRVLSKN